MNAITTWCWQPRRNRGDAAESVPCIEPLVRSQTTIRRGMTELAENSAGRSSGRVRAPGGGRKKAEIANPELVGVLDGLIEPETRGDPESPLRWTTKSTRHLAAELSGMGHSR